MPSAFAVELLYRAVACPPGGGIKLATPKPDTVKSALYRTRRELQSMPDTEDKRLDELTIRTSPSNPSGELWIVRVTGAPHTNGDGRSDA